MFLDSFLISYVFLYILLKVINIRVSRFEPKTIVFKDDAAHKSKIYGNIETWYYDAIFDNGYSIVCLVNLLQFLKKSMVLTGLFFYKENKLIKSFRNRTFLKNSFFSKEIPYIKIDNKEIINGKILNEPNEWVYQILMGDDINSINLHFLKKMKSWKGNHFLGNWLVVPNLKVEGSIFINGKKIEVTGYGYHDHNIYNIYTPFFNKGANYGKITTESLNVVWAQVIKNKNKIENILIINKDQEIISVPSNDIKLSVIDFIKDHGKIVPTKYLLNVQKNGIFINVKIESIDFHFLSIPFVKYWRHHAKNTGEIRVDSVKKIINDIEIIDQLTFL